MTGGKSATHEVERVGKQLQEFIQTLAAFRENVKRRQRGRQDCKEEHQQQRRADHRDGQKCQDAGGEREQQQSHHGDFRGRLVDDFLELSYYLYAEEDTIYPRDFAQQLAANQLNFEVLRMDRSANRIRETLLQNRALGFRLSRRDEVDRVNQKQARQKDKEGN